MECATATPATAHSRLPANRQSWQQRWSECMDVVALLLRQGADRSVNLSTPGSSGT